jgi:hypothetical protein
VLRAGEVASKGGGKIREYSIYVEFIQQFIFDVRIL